MLQAAHSTRGCDRACVGRGGDHHRRRPGTPCAPHRSCPALVLRRALLSFSCHSATDLYGQTAAFMVTSAQLVSAVRGSDLAKDAMRVLCERLAAICYLRQASHMAPRLEDYARRIGQLAKDLQQKAHGGPAGAAAAAAGGLGPGCRGWQ